MDNQISTLLSSLPEITLAEMKGIKLMNRLDTKYVTSKAKLIELLELVRGKYYVQKNHGLRIIPYMTTYYDTVDYKMYMQHHNRIARRTKVRVRTYLASSETFLEVKNKNNHGRTKKKRIEVPSQDDFRNTEGADELVKTRTGLNLCDMHAVVRNQFSRITLVNMDKTERLTIDYNIQFDNCENNNALHSDQLVVIELKRDGNAYSPILNLLRDIHVKNMGFSKCCIGMALTDPLLKKNNFKNKLRKIQKINGQPLIVTQTIAK